MKCNLCPRKCGADRSITKGVCGAGNTMYVARASLHFWEEPCVSGQNGSGTVFFCGCSLRCDFCQNSVISHALNGTPITPNRLYEILFELKLKGAHNINLVTADHYLPYLLPVLRRARNDGLCLPVFVNTSSYLTKQAVESMGTAVDGFIADLKFLSCAAADKYCHAPDYPEIAKRAIDGMTELVGAPVMENGLLKRGVIVRVPVLPNNIIDAKRCMKYIADRYGDKVILSVMSQYTPMPQCTHPELARVLTRSEYNSITKYLDTLNVVGYIQQYGADGENYIPEFNCEGV